MMKSILMIVALALSSAGIFGQSQNWLEHKEYFYESILEHYIQKRGDILESMLDSKVVYGEYNDVSLREDIDFDIFFLKVLSSNYLQRELMYEKKDFAYMIKVWPLSVNKVGGLTCSISLYRISIHYALDTLNLEHIETEQYVFDLKGCALELVD